MVSLAAEERRAWLLQRLSAMQRVSLAEAADELGVSEMTVRRDLDGLELGGTIRRVRGGAMYTGPVSFHGREQSYAAEKAVIAEKLLPLVPDRGIIALDSSTTMHQLAQRISGSGDLTVVTNGMLTFQALQERPGLTAVLTGGAADRRSDSLIGPVATGFVSRVRFSAFFASAAALDERGCHEGTLEEAEVKRAIAAASARVLIGVHREKLDNVSVARAVDISEIDTLATELAPDSRDVAAYRALVSDLR
ncbi:DeoR/GlpR family DNA-binding transcription regulator [Leucobacter luti]|uniref:DeoR/GlpR family DNA-binding transcription regulator n=1 Tax=Leucobacter luti TaxID=340320 RepID=UPI001C6936A0|nr:DeoR/GlpR family DNA-binding transcription regulator [Leucobacter luti]QYM74969.1 DeoR/GlpR family DNA-binding transcription regulator [Leucobacter luti]